ncbi:MAG: M3 family metallopeptidase, partial [Polyangiaceae bacterium]
MPNPLLTERFPIPFDAIEASHVQPAVEELLADAKARLATLEGYDGPLTFDAVLLEMEKITERLEWAMRIVGHLEGVATSEALREAYNAAQPAVSAFENQIPLSAPLWSLLRRYAETDEAKALEGPRKRFLDKTLSYFRRHGAELGDDDKKRLAAIGVELTKLTLRYAQNTLDATNAWELIVTDEAELAGLPESARQAARESAEAKGKEGWRFTLQIPSYIAVMTHLDDPTTREKIYLAMSSRASGGAYDNRAIVMDIIRLRREKASLLGYDTFADLVLEERMAKSASKARAFIDDLGERTRPHFDRERDQLLAFRRELEGPDAPPLQPWDTAYYAEKLRQKVYDFDEEQLKPYFSFKRVLSGIFEIASRIYGIRLEAWEKAPCWDDSVTAYRVVDQRDDRWLAVIYVDPFPRETKQGGAWMDGIVSRARDEEDSRQVAALVANMTPPVGGKDALLSHRDVETLFHEFGHILHHCLSRAALRSQAGTNVAWDFVELPSQIFENWCWERDALDLFARHHETDEPIPEELYQAMNRART